MTRFNAAACCEIVRRYAPDLTLLHVGEPDHSRHLWGVFSEHVRPALDLCEEILEDLLDAIDHSGCPEVYNLVVTADHGHLDTTHTSNPNVLFAENGLLTLDEAGAVTSWRAWSLSAGMSAEIFVNDPADEPLVYGILKQNLGSSGYCRIYSRQEAAQEGFDGPFSFVLETDGHTKFENCWLGECLTRQDSIHGSHGFHPDKGPRPPMLCMGPGFRKGANLPDAHLTDGAPTWAALLGLSLPDADGTALHSLLA